MTPRETSLLLARAGVLLATVATILATMSAVDGRWLLFASNCGMFVICSLCAVVNYRMAGHLG